MRHMCASPGVRGTWISCRWDSTYGLPPPPGPHGCSGQAGPDHRPHRPRGPSVGLLATGTARTACVVSLVGRVTAPRRRDAVGDGVVQLQLSLVYVLAIHLQGRLLLGRVRGAQE